jgi:hypothetical protein
MDTNTTQVEPTPKRQKKAMTMIVRKNAFDIMLKSSKLCWPSQPMSSIPILEIVAQNGWFPWQNNEGNGASQNPDYSNIRLISSEMKKLMDEPRCGGPDFNVIVPFLNKKVGPYCEDNWSGFNCCDCCSCCKDIHELKSTLYRDGVKLNPEFINERLHHRSYAACLLRVLRMIVSRFYSVYWRKWKDMHKANNGEKELDPYPDLTEIDVPMNYVFIFMHEFKEYNWPIYNYLHHLLRTALAISTGWTCDNWSVGNQQIMCEMMVYFFNLHRSDERWSLPPLFLHDDGTLVKRVKKHDKKFELFSLSQILHIPESIRRCVENSIDHKAEALLGKSIADEINPYRLLRGTYELVGEFLQQIEWMPSLRIPEAEFVPLTDFSGYNPGDESQRIPFTDLHI